MAKKYEYAEVDRKKYSQKTIKGRIEAVFLDNIGKIIGRVFHYVVINTGNGIPTESVAVSSQPLYFTRNDFK